MPVDVPKETGTRTCRLGNTKDLENFSVVKKHQQCHDNHITYQSKSTEQRNIFGNGRDEPPTIVKIPLWAWSKRVVGEMA